MAAGTVNTDYTLQRVYTGHYSNFKKLLHNDKN
jgi:hypothetical protein